MPEDREGLRRTFDSVADRYERARPTYPEALYDELAHLADLRPGDRLLEVGCGTGQATVPLARRGFQITCVELGHELAAVARRQLEPFPEVRVVEAPFEEWASAPAEAFDLVYAAAAWRWLDPEVRYPRSWELLRPGGHLAFWSATHVFPEGGDPFFREIQEEYEGYLRTRPGHSPESCQTIAPSLRRPGSSSTWRFATSIGRSSTRLTGTSICSTPSRATSPWRPGNEIGSMARSGVASPSARTGACDATGARFSTWRDAAAEEIRLRQSGMCRYASPTLDLKSEPSGRQGDFLALGL